jgi:hypothetical protein
MFVGRTGHVCHSERGSANEESLLRSVLDQAGGPKRESSYPHLFENTDRLRDPSTQAPASLQLSLGVTIRTCRADSSCLSFRARLCERGIPAAIRFGSSRQAETRVFFPQSVEPPDRLRDPSTQASASLQLLLGVTRLILSFRARLCDRGIPAALRFGSSRRVETRIFIPPMC